MNISIQNVGKTYKTGKVALKDISTEMTSPNMIGKEILAHEIIHQWWGLNRMIWENPDTPEWTSEGLTVYSTYLQKKWYWRSLEF